MILLADLVLLFCQTTVTGVVEGEEVVVEEEGENSTKENLAEEILAEGSEVAEDLGLDLETTKTSRLLCRGCTQALATSR